MDEPEFKFSPRVGMKTGNAYLHGAGDRDGICQTATIVYVGRSYFIMEREEGGEPSLVTEDSYWVVEPNDFQ